MTSDGQQAKKASSALSAVDKALTAQVTLMGSRQIEGQDVDSTATRAENTMHEDAVPVQASIDQKRLDEEEQHETVQTSGNQQPAENPIAEQVDPEKASAEDKPETTAELEPITSSDNELIAGAAKPFAYSSTQFRTELDRSQRLSRRRKVLGVFLGLLLALIVVLVVVVIVRFSVNTVSDSNMGDSLSDGQVVLFEKGVQPAAGDIVAYSGMDGSICYGRVVAGPNEWVNIGSDGTVVVGGSPQTIGSSKSSASASSGSTVGTASNVVQVSAQVPDNTYCVIPDGTTPVPNWLESGEYYVLQDDLIGRATFRIWPLGDFSIKVQ